MKQFIESGITPLGVATFRNRDTVFGIKKDDRRRHVYIIGKTGMGKTTLIENMVYADVISGRGVCYVDPHGDTAEKMLSWIPASRINDVVYFNPADYENPISFNVLEKVDPHYRHLVASGLIGVFKKLWADSWGPRLEYLLRNAILALLEYPDSTLLGINRLLVDKEYRNKVIAKVQDPVVRQFWTEEYTKYGGQFQVEAIAPIQNKVGQFLSTSLIRNIVGQVQSSIDLRKVMDEGKILILNLSKGRIGEDASALFGSMMVTKLQLAAMSRVDMPEEERKDFYLYVDEFQNFATDSFADILSEARKYHLCLNIAHQYVEQLGEVVQPAVFGNVGTMIVFRIGAADAEFLEKEFAPHILPEDLINLPKFEYYTKLMIDGVSSEPFSARGLPPIFRGSMGNEEKVIKVSRERYAKPRDIVEDKIKRWSESKNDEVRPATAPFKKDDRSSFGAPQKSYAPRPSTSPAARQDQNVAPKTGFFEADCANCGKKVEVPFKPDNIRPVFCKDCLKKARRGQIQGQPVKETMEVKEMPVKEKSISLTEIPKQTKDFKGRQVPKKEEAVRIPVPEIIEKPRPEIKKEEPKPKPVIEIKKEEPKIMEKAYIPAPEIIEKPKPIIEEKKEEPKPIIKPLPEIKKPIEVKVEAPKPEIKKEIEVKVEKPKPEIKKEEPKSESKSIKIEEKKPVPKLEEVEELPKKKTAPAVDFLRTEDEENEGKKLKEGEIIEL
ncbi:type IV secretion system DNA-binding domain-containing protein [Candidatus Falkowbacteria bacterium]|nr:type IV secretion system DNA-binding domain-containing protein [Candidatus Falkowbacteria bacterium]